jgi:serine/threonine-protein kinase
MSTGAEQGQEAQGVEGLPANAAAASFGKYALFASLGRGGMADVFLSIARGPMGFNKLAVVKRLRTALADDPAFRTMFLDEARLAARLNHPNIVHTYEVGEQDGNYFIAMEYLEGQALNKVIRASVKANDPLEQTLCARMIAEALAGLHHAHETRDYDGRPLDIIHRDISPHNIFVTYGGQVTLVDFGIAKAALSSTETEIGVLKGKVAYMSPEQAIGSKCDRRADIFAMGIVLWELLTRQRLMTGDSAASTLHRLLNSPIPTVSSARPDIDPELDAIVARALEKDVRYRFQTAQEMRDALDSFIASTGKTVRQDEIGRKIAGMFERTRQDIQRQIQEHMEKVTHAANTEELAALNAEAIKRLGNGVNSSSALMKLGVNSGSGSGVVPNFGRSSSVMGPSIPPRADVVQAQESDKKKSIVIVLLVGVAVLLVMVVGALVFIGMRKQPQVAPIASTADPVAPTAAGTGSAIGTPTTESTVSFIATPPSTNTAKPTTTHTGSGPAIKPTAHTQTTVKPPTTASAAAPAGDEGFLTLQTYPWTKVSEGGKVLGNTPILKRSMSPGVHNLVAEDESGQKHEFAVTIKSGDTTTKNMSFK